MRFLWCFLHLIFSSFLMASCQYMGPNINDSVVETNPQNHFEAHKKAKKFMPENELYLQDDLSSSFLNMTQSQFLILIKEVENLYKGLASKHGGNLVFVNEWYNPTVNAYAVRNGEDWEVHMFGGMARRKEITADGFQMVICHELGHHLAGFPFVQEWAANEGQSDYFAAQACARKIWEKQIDKNATFEKNLSVYPKKKCDSSWKTKEQRQLCYRVLAAGKSLATLLSNGAAQYETPDMSQVFQTDNEHPNGQCRLDTYVAGAICKKNFASDMIPQDEMEASKSACLQSKNEKGFRPRCWFAPLL